ncbi:hypothetical protein PR202_gb00189 [Eleusine coracana subsp. coracana]|uniref:Uncharacterized protein n=1 Tax=Eleusine coracana subsp. coracana TaxID=191504 RepID=A0AAV5DU90_ELECO|nr:hypothetical protein PR202_gb00189 [Eleusine coracana subsp. coracana]
MMTAACSSLPRSTMAHGSTTMACACGQRWRHSSGGSPLSQAAASELLSPETLSPCGGGGVELGTGGEALSPGGGGGDGVESGTLSRRGAVAAAWSRGCSLAWWWQRRGVGGGVESGMLSRLVAAATWSWGREVRTGAEE